MKAALLVLLCGMVTSEALENIFYTPIDQLNLVAYLKRTCSQSKKLKGILDRNNIPVTVHYVDDDKNTADFVEQTNDGKVPMLFSNGKRIYNITAYLDLIVPPA
jgi:glutaredoxin